ncbi:acyl-CoA dehydrogenase family member 11 [Lingula anatina]|uniref:Acyl-CoA dehydrogenase family member 11 n=1 Tax=Lingula anatina TaxID=7574 RepID=A0A1S3II38_LINAN|nr:acyl-CoA dehydrogenase family member 11 [Lingula anatina]|eukprot:XP_013397159.1 acyl-CoA dehydrogenase family member 11 [Lingula anatina]
MLTFRCPRNNLYFLRECGNSLRRKTTVAAAAERSVGTCGSDLGTNLYIPFTRAKIGDFFQPHPKLGNTFTEDPLLKGYLRRVIPHKFFTEISSDLEKFGHRVATDIYELHLECDRNPPTLEQYDAWGNRVDRLHTCHAWKKMHDISAEEGVIAIAYERQYEQFSRLYQIAKMSLFQASSGLYGCPLAMTDGAAKVIENLPDVHRNSLQTAYSRLISREPSKFWTSGQWMTERRGGSDVGHGTETLAQAQSDGTYKLYGYKWFSSATDSDIAFTLARTLDVDGKSVAGSKGLSLFYLKVVQEDGCLNNIQVQKLKNKMGTKQLPTAELLLDGTVAQKVSEEGRGVPAIASMLTVSRIHTAMMSLGCMRRVLHLARDYCTRREAFGKRICDYPLHMQTLAHMEVETRGAEILVLEVGRLLGLDDCNIASETDLLLLRLLTPVVKLYISKQSIGVISEGLESFGGQGIIEDTGIPAILRDAQIMPIWEGTTNILSLDVLRAIMKTEGRVLKAFYDAVQDKVSAASKREELSQCCENIQKAADEILKFAKNSTDSIDVAARDFAFSLAKTYIGALLVEHAMWTEASPLDIATAQRWCARDMVPVVCQQQQGRYSKAAVQTDYELVMEGYQPKL